MRVCICGAGIAGLAAAWWMDRLGWDVHVVERAPSLRDDGYMIDFFGSGYDAAEMMGLIPRLMELQYAIDGVAFVDDRGDRRAWLSYQFVRDALQGRLMPLMRGDLERVLFDALPPRVRVSFDRRVRSLALGPEHVGVRFDDDDVEVFDLLIGADGIHSEVRSLLFGSEAQYLRFLGYHAASYLFRDDELRDDLRDGFMQVYSAPGRQLGLYPLRDGRIAALFAFRASTPQMPSSPRDALQRLYGALSWHVPRALAACPEDTDIYYDVVAQIELPSWHDRRVVLVGDACEAVSLLAGQGASMAMGGPCVLASELANAWNVDEALARYQRRVQPAIIEKQAAGRRIASWFVPATSGQIGLRNLIMNVATSPALGWILKRPLAADGRSVVREADRRRLTPGRRFPDTERAT